MNPCPSSFLGFKKAPDLLWTREVEGSGKIGRALNSVLLKLKNWHLCNMKQRADQIQSSTAKFLIVKQSTKKSTHVPPSVGDIVCLSTNNNERHIGQILEIKRQTARVLCQDRVYSQPISFLSPLYTEQDEGKQLKPLVGIDNARAQPSLMCLAIMRMRVQSRQIPTLIKSWPIGCQYLSERFEQLS